MSMSEKAKRNADGGGRSLLKQRAASQHSVEWHRCGICVQLSSPPTVAAATTVTVDTTSGFRKWDEAHFEKLAAERKLREAEGDGDAKGISATQGEG